MSDVFGLALQIGGYVLAIPLEILVIQALLRGEFRRYPFLLLYLIVDLLTSLMEIVMRAMTVNGARPRRTFILLYWYDEQIIQFLLFVLVVSLVYRSSEHIRSRRMLVAVLVCFSLLFAGGSLWFHYRPELTVGKWMTPFTRDLNFGAAVLDLGLWALLISRPKRDWRLLMVSGALGIQFTAGAIGQALREISHETVFFTSVLMMFANVACLYVWRQAFRSYPNPKELQAAKK